MPKTLLGHWRRPEFWIARDVRIMKKSMVLIGSLAISAATV